MSAAQSDEPGTAALPQSGSVACQMDGRLAAAQALTMGSPHRQTAAMLYVTHPVACVWKSYVED
jgi:hypothetical protein